MAASTQDLEALRESLNERITAVDKRIDTGGENLASVHEEIKKAFEELRNQISQPGNVVHSSILGIVSSASEPLMTRIHQCEQEILRARGYTAGPKWNIKDPKARGTVKFGGEQKDDVKVFVQWRKHAVIYLEKFVPHFGKFLSEMTALATMDEVEISNIIAKNDLPLTFEEIQDTLHYFLFEHLTDAAADLVESCGLDGCDMWRTINAYYEPTSHSTHANIHAAVYEMSRRKAKTPGEMHGLFRELEKRLQKLKQIDGDITEIAKASIVYNMMDDATQKLVCDAGKNADFEFMRKKIIREGSEAREKTILKHAKTVPMELDSLEAADEDVPECRPCGAEINAVVNPNIVCFVCKEKGHIARNCPHNDGKTSRPLTPAGRGDDWWYSGKGANKGNNKGNGKGGKGKGKGKFGKGYGRKGFGKAYSLEYADDWTEFPWWNDAASGQGSIRSLERLSTLQQVQDAGRAPVRPLALEKPVQTIAKENEKTEFHTPWGKTKGKLKFTQTDAFNEVLHNSISYNNMVTAFWHMDEENVLTKKFQAKKLNKETDAKTPCGVRGGIGPPADEAGGRNSKDKGRWRKMKPTIEAEKIEKKVRIGESQDDKEVLVKDDSDSHPELADSDDEDVTPIVEERYEEDMVPPWLTGGRVCRGCKLGSELAAMHGTTEFHFCESCRAEMKKRADLPRTRYARESDDESDDDIFEEFIKPKTKEKANTSTREGGDVQACQTENELIIEVKEKMHKKLEKLRKKRTGEGGETNDVKIVKKIKVRKERSDEEDDGDAGDFFMGDDSQWVEVSYKKPQQDKKKIQWLREVREGSLSAVAQPEWEEITITVDSGASETVAPLNMAMHVPIESSEASLRGAKYEVANGGVLHNKGEKNCIVQAFGGSAKLLCFQVCDVHKPLLAVSKLCEAGNAVVFHPDWSYIENLKTGERTTLEKKDGLYELRVWVRSAKGFTRQDQAP